MSIRLRLPHDLYLRLTELASKKGVSLNMLMVSLLGAGTGETPTYRRKQLLAAVTAADLEQKLGEAVQKWDGREVRLYEIRGGRSASLKAAQEQAEENERHKPWGVAIGSYARLLQNAEGDRLKRELAKVDLSYIRDPGRGRPMIGRQRHTPVVDDVPRPRDR